ncbi:MAG: glycoside hydrolase family 5 protein [Treponema sp.]|jgi:endoglucanase|nr:glycoside hydrolase family 5 protein [Treponema sp.]
MQRKFLLFVCTLCIAVGVLTAGSCASGKTAVALTADKAFDYTPVVPDAVNNYPQESIGGKSAIEYLKSEKVVAGLNIGNTLDAWSGNIDENGKLAFVQSGENASWGNPRINQELFNGIKAAGFSVVRVPVTWMGYIGPAPDFHIDEPFLKRVAEIAGYAKNAGLKMIINLHHDGATDSKKGDQGWLSVRQASKNQDEFNRITSQYVRVWKQISAYLKNYGDWLIFESFNELHDGNWGSGGQPGQYITLIKWNQFFVDTVRSTGGNNESRYLMIPAYCNDRRQLLSAGFVLPNDTADNKLIVSFHYYDPYEFGIQGSQTSWGTSSEKQKVVNDFAAVKVKFVDNNIPVIIGECGAVMQLYPDDSAIEQKARQSRREYLSYIFGTAKQYGLVPIYWDNGSVRGNGEKFGLFDRRNGQPNSDESKTLIKLMIEAVR